MHSFPLPARCIYQHALAPARERLFFDGSIRPEKQAEFREQFFVKLKAYMDETRLLVLDDPAQLADLDKIINEFPKFREEFDKVALGKIEGRLYLLCSLRSVREIADGIVRALFR